jgi:hypothetical protein
MIYIKKIFNLLFLQLGESTTSIDNNEIHSKRKKKDLSLAWV